MAALSRKIRYLTWMSFAILLVVFGAWILVRSGAIDSWNSPDGYAPDLAYDKYTTLAAWQGWNPYAPMNQLTAHYGYAGVAWPVPAPRTPATFVVHAPLALIPDPALLWTMLPVTAAIVTACFWAAARLSAWPDPLWVLIGLIVVSLTVAIYVRMVIWASATMIVPGLIAVAMVLLHDRPRPAGALIGMAAAIKLWPGIIVLSLIVKCRQSAAWAICAGGLVTGIGLLAPGASITGTVSAVSEAVTYFTGPHGPPNLSVTAALGAVGLLPGIALFVWGLRGSADRSVGSSVVSGLMLSPFSWPYYWLAAVPVAGLLARHLSEWWTSRWDDFLAKDTL